MPNTLFEDQPSARARLGWFTNPIRLNLAVRAMVKEHAIQCEALTELQLVVAIQQALKAGDFVRLVHATPDGEHEQMVVYQPFRDVEGLKSEIACLQQQIVELKEACAAAQK